MSNINLYEVYERKRRKYGVTDLQDYRDTFVDAVNLTYSELNEKVFEANTLEPISSFDDIIDTRLASFGTITFDDPEPNDAISDREFWSVEWDFERTSATNGFTDTITDDASGVVLSIANNVFSINGDAVAGSASLPESDVFTLRFESDKDGNRVLLNGDIVEMLYTTGDGETAQNIGEVSAHVISGVSGYELTKTRFLTAGTLVYSFDIDDGSTALTDNVSAFTASVGAGEWDTRYIEPSTSLDFRYRSALEFGTDFHLQDGGQWGLEPDAELERKWYGRGISSAREVYSQLTPYKSPLNIGGE